jgi:uncharacterized protein involved in exopolysaccharide biosynthesis
MEDTEGKGTIEQWLGKLLLQNLDVEPSSESSVITIAFTGSDPQFAATMANAFAKTYIETSLELRLTPLKQTAAWFDQQITQLRENLDQAQQKLNAYQREKGIVESEERLDVETRRMADLAGQMVAAQSASFDAASRTRDSSSLPEVINNPVVQGLKAQVAQGEGKLAEWPIAWAPTTRISSAFRPRWTATRPGSPTNSALPRAAWAPRRVRRASASAN